MTGPESIHSEFRRRPPRAPVVAPVAALVTAPVRRRWQSVMHGTFAAIASDRIGLVAAGCAFWATLALFPAISMVVSLYGLVFDPAAVEPQLATLRDLVLGEAFALIAGRVHVLVSHGSGTLGVSLAVSSVIALWSAATGTKSMLAALNLANEAYEQRSFLAFQAIGLTLTLGGILVAILALAILVALPAAIDFVGISAYGGLFAQGGSLLMLVVFVLLSISVFYRIGPCRPKGGPASRPSWITPGAVLATAVWLAASVAVSFYVGHLATYDATYGPLGAVAGVMIWFWVSAYVVLAGAELNAQLELAASTAG